MPPLNTTAGPNSASTSADAPLSPIDAPAPTLPITSQPSFQHRTLSAAPTHTHIPLSTPAINTHPIELDGTPTSPIEKPVKSGSIGSGGIGGLGGLDLQERMKDPAVLVQIPGTPGAEEMRVVAEEGRRGVQEGGGAGS